MVDLSDVRSMSRPCSPLSVFPSPCIIRPVTSKQQKHTHTRAPECCPHSSENANARMAVVLMKGNYPERQAPSTSQGQGGQQRDKQTPYSPHRGLPLSLSFFHFVLFQPVSFSLHSPAVTNLGCKNGGKEPSYWKPGKYCPSVAIFKVSLVSIYDSIWPTNASQSTLTCVYLCLFARQKHSAVFLLS